MRCSKCDRVLDAEDYIIDMKCPFCHEVLTTKEDDINGTYN